MVMKKFMDDNFMLNNETAVKLFNDYAKDMPIFDYHCHLSPQMMYEDKPFENITQIFLGGDHYKWRYMRSNGIDESYITGDKSDYDKFKAFCGCLQYAIGNPLYHWTHLELKRYFNVDEVVTAENCDTIWEKCNKVIKETKMSPSTLINQSNVAVLCTTDDPIDSLEYHKLIAEKGHIKAKVVITATDPDHLDIYGTEKAYLESFEHYTTLIQPGGALIIRKGISLQPKVQAGVRVYTYSRDEGDFHAENIRIGNGEIFIDFVAPDTRINNIQLGVPVSINIENGVAAMALAHLNGVTDEEIRQGMNSFRGVDRRFDFKIKNDQVVFLSDYAHHPSEIKQSVLSIRELYKDKKITAIFQPHLYTRTRDFYQDFADSLSLLDEVILVDIYPARETPIPGVTSKLIYDNLRPGIEKSMCKKEEILNILKDKNIEVLITLGAGDIDNYVPEIKKELEKMKNEERRTKN